MPATLLRRSLKERSVTEDAGKRIQDWVASRSPNAIFVITVVSYFIALLILLGSVWESLRRCRSSLRSGEQERWHRLRDGSAVRARDGLYAGPMATLLREGATGTGGGSPYAPARAGVPGWEQRMDAHAMSGVYAAYDPPVRQPMGYPGPLAQGQVYPPHHHQQQQQGSAPVDRPASVGTVESGWSERTRVGDEGVGQKGEENKATTFAAVDERHNQPQPQNQLFLPEQPQPPPSPQPAISSTPVSFVAPATVPIKPSGHVSTPSISHSITTSYDLPLPGTPRSSVLNPLSFAASVGESAFSTPKTTPSPAVGARPSHKRGASSGAFTPMPLALSTAASTRSLSASSTLSGPEPPKVELKRTWSIGTWIPQLKEGGGASEARKEDGDEEEKVGLVGRG